MNEKRIVQIASIPSRVEHLEITVNSLIDQCDEMFIALNNYAEVPAYLQGNPKITYKLMDNSLGDAAKFWDVDKKDGYIFTCDDDLKYNHNYIQLMINGMRTHGGAVTMLGKVYGNRPITSFRRGYTILYSCLNNVKQDAPVDIVGTGVLGFHTSSIKISIADFKHPNMADIWFSKVAHEQGVKLTVLAHHKSIVRYRMHSWRIWAHPPDHNYQIEVVNSFLK